MAVKAYVLGLIVLTVFFALGIEFWRFHISYRVSVIAGLILLVAAAIAVTTSEEVAGDFLAIPAYYSLVMGLSVAIIEYVREEKHKKVRSSDPTQQNNSEVSRT